MRQSWLAFGPNGIELRFLMLASSVAFLLAGCGPDTVLVQPVAIKDVPAELLAKPRVPKCLVRKEDYGVDEVSDAHACERAAAASARANLRALQQAVRSRQAVAKSITTP